MELIRKQLKPLLRNLQTAHAGLLIQRGLPFWEDGEKESKRELLHTISQVHADDLYQLAFKRWLFLTYDQPKRFAQTSATITGRLFSGLSIGGTLETGAMTHHTYGMPMLAGSSIKGATKAYASAIGLDAKYIETLFGSGDDEEAQASQGSGCLVWHDAWWIPNTKEKKPFAGEVITVHHQEYYSEKTAQADGTESPIPNQQLAIQGSFYFVIEGDEQWAQFALDLLNNMLQEQGLGAKAASGYGYFLPDERVSKQLQKAYLEALGHAPDTGSDADPQAKLRAIIKILSENDLVENLSKGKNKWFAELKIDAEDAVALNQLRQLVLELHADKVKTWEAFQSDKKNNKGKAYKWLHSQS